MYCSSCGNEIKKGLNYCSSCGARIIDPEAEAGGSRFQNISTAIGFVGLGGIIGFIFLVKLLLEHKFPEGPMVMILFAFLATIFGISFLLIRQLSASSREVREKQTDFRTDTAPKYMSPVNTHQLEEPAGEPASVVENTTRTLDEVMIERK
jgi:hypothetical protein